MNLKRRSFATKSKTSMGYLHRVRLVKNLYWHFAGILLGLPERKDLESFEAPVNFFKNLKILNFLKLSKKCRVGFYLPDKIALNPKLLRL